MLTSDQLDALTDPITDLYDEYMQTVINDIARRLVKMGKPTATAAWQLQRLQESGKVYENAIKELSKLTGQSEQVLRETFETAGVQTMRFDDRVYKAAGLNPLPLHLSPAMAQVLSAGLQKTGGLIHNLTMTTANSAQKSFIHAADLAYMQVSTGVLSYDEAIRRAIKGVASDGLSIISYPSGHQDLLDVAMRRAVLTGVSQTSGQLQMTRMDEMGVDLVQVSAHIGARPDHQIWQGGIFSRSGTDRLYKDFISTTGYGTGPGLGGWNCRHSFYPYFKGISRPLYDEITKADYKKKTVQYNGQDVPIYEATQIQRGIERKIRAWKRQASALEACGLSNVKEIGKVRQWQETMRDFIKQTGLQRQGVRERIVLPGDRGQPKIFKGTGTKPKPPRPPKPKPPTVIPEKTIPPKFDPQKLREDLIASKGQHEAQLTEFINKRTAIQAEKDIFLKQITELNEELSKLGYEDTPENIAKRNAIHDRMDELWKLTHPLNEKMSVLYKQEAELLNNAKKKARALLHVDNPIDTKLTGTAKSIKEMRAGIDEVFKLVDKSVVKSDNNEIKIVFRKGRAYYLDTSNQIKLEKNAVRTFAHEYGHFLEDEGNLREVAQAFLNRRTEGESPQQLRRITGNSGYRRDEYAKVDRFNSPYMGKIYKSGHTEIISMGLEWLYYDPVEFAEKDPDYFDFIITLLRGIQ